MSEKIPSKKEVDKKIIEAKVYCDNALTKLLEKFKQYIPNEDTYYELSELILANTYFAGGVLRSILTNSQINDIDIFFNSKESIDKFEHIISTHGMERLKDQLGYKKTGLGSHNFQQNGRGSPKISFITKRYGSPIDVMRTFDFNFNRNFYVMHSGEHSIDEAVFSKKAKILNFARENIFNIAMRVFRFMQEGYTFRQQDLIYLLISINRYGILETPQELSFALHNSSISAVTNTRIPNFPSMEIRDGYTNYEDFNETLDQAAEALNTHYLGFRDLNSISQETIHQIN